MSIEVKFKGNHIQVANINYFTTNAPGIELGCWGEKKSPLTAPNYLLVEGRVPAAKLKVRKSLDMHIDSATLTEAGIGAGITVAGIGKLSASAAASKFKSNEMRLMLLEVLPADLAAAANDSPAVIDGFQRVGDDGRLVHKVLVALDAKSAEVFNKAGSVSASVDAGVFKVTAGGNPGSSGSTTVSFENCTVGYLLMKVTKWDANQKKNWKRMLDWDDDRWSLN